jgi:hypothetical protein
VGCLHKSLLLLLSAPLLLLAAPLLLLAAPLLLLAAPLVLDEWQGSAWPYDGMRVQCDCCEVVTGRVHVVD